MSKGYMPSRKSSFGTICPECGEKVPKGLRSKKSEEKSLAIHKLVKHGIR